MGWTTERGATKADVIRERIAREENSASVLETLEHKLVGDVLWTIRKTTYKTGERAGTSDMWIGCDLLAEDYGFGWGYKDMEESMGPRETSCPVSFLDRVPDPGGYATKWRERVRAGAQVTAK